VGGRERILQVHSRNKPIGDSVDFGLLARQTSGLTGADLANICNEAAIFAARRDANTVEMGDFDTALERVVAGMQSRRTLSDHERKVVAYHEAGHALCGELLPSVDRVHRISIVPRGKALGYTLNLPEEDRYLKTREELIDMMTMLLGGRTAEELVFGSITTGASDDLRRVAGIAHSMVHDYAMGTEFTSMQVASDGQSETTRRVSDEEVREAAIARDVATLMKGRWVSALVARWLVSQPELAVPRYREICELRPAQPSWCGGALVALPYCENPIPATSLVATTAMMDAVGAPGANAAPSTAPELRRDRALERMRRELERASDAPRLRLVADALMSLGDVPAPESVMLTDGTEASVEHVEGESAVAVSERLYDSVRSMERALVSLPARIAAFALAPASAPPPTKPAAAPSPASSRARLSTI